MKNDLAWEQHKNGCGLLLSCLVTSLVSHCRQLISRLCYNQYFDTSWHILNNVYIASWHVIQTRGSKLISAWGPCRGEACGPNYFVKKWCACKHTEWSFFKVMKLASINVPSKLLMYMAVYFWIYSCTDFTETDSKYCMWRKKVKHFLNQTN